MSLTSSNLSLFTHHKIASLQLKRNPSNVWWIDSISRLHNSTCEDGARNSIAASQSEFTQEVGLSAGYAWLKEEFVYVSWQHERWSYCGQGINTTTDLDTDAVTQRAKLFEILKRLASYTVRATRAVHCTRKTLWLFNCTTYQFK